jgi:hypothetical protein
MRRLKEIRDSSRAEEQTAMWDRNILSLIKLRIQKSQQMDAENTSYQQKKADDQRAARDELDDQKRQQAIQRRDRLIAYQQANEDAKKQYERDLQQAAAAKAKAIELAAKAETAELQQQADKTRKALDLGKQQATAEVKLATMTADARMKLLKAEMDADQQWAYRLISGASGGSTGSSGGGSGAGHAVRTRAGGGAVQAGQVYQVNDDLQQRTESFNGASFPPGLGLFIPAQNGMVQPANASRSVSRSLTLQVPISGVQDPVAFARMAIPLIQREIVAFYDEVDDND